MKYQMKNEKNISYMYAIVFYQQQNYRNEN